MSLPSSGGTYALLLSAAAPVTIKVGALGRMELPAGFGLYVGSALGPGGLRARIGHHGQSSARPRWHIDYLRGVTQLEEVWYTTDPVRRECQWAGCLGDMAGAEALVEGFGSSDCDCGSHFFFYDRRPVPGSFRARLRRMIPEHQAVRFISAGALVRCNCGR